MTEQLTKEEILDITQTCYNSTRSAAKIIYPERFYRDFDKEHEKIFDLLDNSDNPRKVIAAPRGTGKTSLSNLVIPTKKLAFLDSHFMVPVSNTAESAIQQSENLKAEFMHNNLLRSMVAIDKTKNFSKKQWTVEIAEQTSMIWPKGAGQQVRGMLYKNYRPDLIVVDDLENDKNVYSEEQRKWLKEWFFGALMGIVDRGRDDWEIIYIDTLKHEDSLLQDLLDDPDWDHVILELFDDNHKTKFPNMISDEEVDKLVRTYRQQGQMDVLYREFRNLPISTEDAAFMQEFFRYYNAQGVIQPEFFDRRKHETIIVIDPAKTAKMSSADSALVGGSLDMGEGRIYFRDIVAGKFHPDELYNEMVSMIKRLRPSVVGVEVTGLNEFITYPLKTVLAQHAPQVELIELHARGGVNEPGKVARIKSLIPFYRQGLIFHNEVNSGGLEAQLLSFPRSKRWDIMDAAAYFIELLERGKRYAHSLQDVYPSKEELEKEWEELGYTEAEENNSLYIRSI